MDLQKIADNLIKSVATGELCRLWARELSEIKPQLDAHNVRLIGIGLEELGLQAFLDGEFFKGDLYIDLKKQCYKDLEFRRYNALTMLGGLAAKETRQGLSRSNALGIKGDLKGDALQIGGELVVAKGGEKVLLFHKQANPGDHPKINDILKVLSIEPVAKQEPEGDTPGADEATPEVACEEACAMKPPGAADGTAELSLEAASDKGQEATPAENDKGGAEGSPKAAQKATDESAQGATAETAGETTQKATTETAGEGMQEATTEDTKEP